jgi:hypothetical protein
VSNACKPRLSHASTILLRGIFLWLGVSGSGHAATICVQANDGLGLQSALAVAATNGEDDLIQLQGGQYDMPSNFPLEYYPNLQQNDLTIEGGYADFFGNPCGLAPSTPDARQTVLNGGQLKLTMPGGAGSITLKAITISNMVNSNQQSIPVSIGGLAGSTGNVSIYNVIFEGNGSSTNEAIFLSAIGGFIRVQNSIFLENYSFAGVNPIDIVNFSTSGNLCLEVINSTFTSNAASRSAVKLRAPMCQSLLANDILWGNSGGDIDISYPATTILVNDDLGDLAEAAGTQSSALLSIDPMFYPDASLKDLSPLRDAGNDGGFVFSPGPYDVVGNQRVYGSHPDIGAFEIQDVIFAHGFDFQPPF